MNLQDFSITLANIWKKIATLTAHSTVHLHLHPHMQHRFEKKSTPASAKAKSFTILLLSSVKRYIYFVTYVLT